MRSLHAAVLLLVLLGGSVLQSSWAEDIVERVHITKVAVALTLAYLEVMHGSYKGRTYKITKQMNTIG